MVVFEQLALLEDPSTNKIVFCMDKQSVVNFVVSLYLPLHPLLLFGIKPSHTSNPIKFLLICYTLG
jgi:hypothetical protein